MSDMNVPPTPQYYPPPHQPPQPPQPSYPQPPYPDYPQQPQYPAGPPPAYQQYPHNRTSVYVINPPQDNINFGRYSVNTRCPVCQQQVSNILTASSVADIFTNIHNSKLIQYCYCSHNIFDTG